MPTNLRFALSHLTKSTVDIAHITQSYKHAAVIVEMKRRPYSMRENNKEKIKSNNVVPRLSSP